MKKLHKLLLISVLILSFGARVQAQLQFTMINHQTQDFSITNFGAQIDIATYRLCSEFQYSALNAGEISIQSGDLDLGPGETVTGNWNSAGGFTNTASDMGLYLPSGSFASAANMVCFVQYGAGDQGREDVAVAAGYWVEDTFVSGVGPYVYIGDGTQSGAEFWINYVEPVFPYVVINEVDCDTPSADLLEFIELFGDPNAPLDGLVVVFLNGLNEESYAAYDLDGLSLDGDGFFLLGNVAVPNASIVFPDNSLQNGADAVAVYQGSVADWPNGTAASSDGLVDLLVYDTDDADDAELLVFLTLGTQINESQGGDSADLSCSRIPDGGEELNTLSYVAQGPTPGVSNLLPCDAGTVAFEAGGDLFTLCTANQSTTVGVVNDAANSNGTYTYIITSNTNTFLEQQVGPMDMNAFAVDTYHVYGYSSTGTPTTEWMIGDDISTLATTGCYELSSNFLTLIIEECVQTCEAGSLSLGEGILAITVCKDAQPDEVTLVPEGNDINAGLNWVITDISNEIVSFPNQTTDLNELDFGSYRIWSFGFLGNIDISTTEVGDLITEIVADCFDLSSNFISVTVNDCTAPGCDELFFSEYIEGLSNNKVIEIYNPLPFAVDLSQYSVLLYFNGNVSADDTFLPTGLLESGDVFVIAGPSSSGDLLALADAIDNVAAFNGNDALELRHNSLLVDVIGEVGEDPGASWVVGSGSTKDHVLVRKADVNNGETQWTAGQSEWDVYEPDDFTHLGEHIIVPCGGVSLPYVFFDEAFSMVTESDGDITIGITVVNPISEAVVEVNIFGGDATEGLDYTSSLPITLTFPEGTVETQFVTISLIDDLLEEGVENIILTLSGDDAQVNFLLATHNLIIEHSDTYYAPYEISQVTGMNELGVADSTGIYCELSGVVHGPNFNSAGVQFTLIDATDGIGVFAPLENFGYTVNEGDQVIVGGEIIQFMGLTQILVDYITLVSSGNILEEPVLVAELGEDNESHMVRLNCVTIVDPELWTNQGGGFTVQMTDGLEIFDVRIDSDCDLFGTNPPEGTFNMVGIGSQFDSEGPYDGGYQMYPRYLEDIQNPVVADFTMDPDDFIIYGDDGTEVVFTNTGSGAVVFDWNFGDTEGSTDENPVHNYSFDFLDSVTEVIITLTATGSTGCTHSYSITIDAVYIGIDEGEDVEITVYPNPSSEKVSVISDAEIQSIRAYNAVGDLVWNSGTMNQKTIDLFIADWSSGMYLLDVMSKGQSKSIRLMVQ